MPLLSNNNDLTVRINTTSDTSGIDKTEDSLNGLSGSAEKTAPPLKKLNDLMLPFAGLAAAAAVGLSKLGGFLSDSSDEASTLSNSLTGLSSIAAGFGQDVDKAKDAAKRLASDGLMTVADAATGLKNLLASGFSLDEAVTLMNRFRDSAAFGRQASLGFGEAVKTATEGIKNGNSILVDNAGVTKNLSVILKEHGKSVNDVMNIQSDASVRQALYNGLLEETSHQVGDASKLTQQFAGQQAKAAAQVTVLKQSIGTAVQAALLPLIRAITPIISGLADFAKKHQALVAGLAVGVTTMLALGAAIGGIGLALSIVTPLIAAFGVTAVAAMAAATAGISLLVGALVAVGVNMAMQKNQSDQLKGAQDSLKQSTDALRDAQNTLAQAHLNEEGATLRVEQAQRFYNDTVRQFGPNSLEARQALHDLKQAQEDLRNAQDNTRNSQQALLDKEREVAKNKELVAHLRELQGNLDGVTSRAVTAGQKIQLLNGAKVTVKTTQGTGINAGNEVIDFKATFGKNATGTRNYAGGATVVGENGPELVTLPRGSSIYTNTQTENMLGGNGGSTNNFYGNIILGSASAVTQFFQDLNNDSILASKGLTVRQGI